MCRRLFLAVAFFTTVGLSALAADGPLFPTPFLVEHQVVQSDPDGSVFAAPPVVDHYGGSWIVSVRPDGSRTVLDLARREVLEVDVSRSTYSVLTFDRWGDLVRRLRTVEQGAPKAAPENDAEQQAPEYLVQPATTDGLSRTLPTKSRGNQHTPHTREGVQHLRVSVQGKAQESPVLEAWADPRVRLSATAVAALAELDRTLVGGARSGLEVTYPAMIAAARSGADGALLVRTLRPMTLGGDPAKVGLMEDVALRVETGISFPLELVEVPEGFQRVPHVLETTVNWAEADAELRRRMTDVSE